MSQRGPSGYGVGPPPSYGGGMSAAGQQSNDSGFVEQLRPYTTKVEDFLESISDPIKP